MTFEVWTEQVDYRRRTRLVIADRRGPETFVAQPLVFNLLPENDLSERPPTMELPTGDVTQFLQAMLDEAWRRGLRPAGVLDATNQVAALREHLKDMQDISFRLLDTVAPVKDRITVAKRDLDEEMPF